MCYLVLLEILYGLIEQLDVISQLHHLLLTVAGHSAVTVSLICQPPESVGYDLNLFTNKILNGMGDLFDVVPLLSTLMLA